MDYARYRRLPNTLRKHRKSLGLTQKGVGERLHIDPDCVSHWENGDSLPNLISAMRLSGLYETSIEELFTGLAGAVCGRKDKKG